MLKKGAYHRRAEFPTKHVLGELRKGTFSFAEFTAKFSTHSSGGVKRLNVFNSKGLDCCVPGCCVKGSFFALERHANYKPSQNQAAGWHLNLYGYDEFGGEVMVTVDHILPVSKGGSNHMDNLQPMCAIHNHAKGNLTVSVPPKVVVKKPKPKVIETLGQWEDLERKEAQWARLVKKLEVELGLTPFVLECYWPI